MAIPLFLEKNFFPILLIAGGLLLLYLFKRFVIDFYMGDIKKITGFFGKRLERRKGRILGRLSKTMDNMPSLGDVDFSKPEKVTEFREERQKKLETIDSDLEKFRTAIRDDRKIIDRELREAKKLFSKIERNGDISADMNNNTILQTKNNYTEAIKGLREAMTLFQNQEGKAIKILNLSDTKLIKSINLTSNLKVSYSNEATQEQLQQYEESISDLNTLITELTSLETSRKTLVQDVSNSAASIQGFYDQAEQARQDAQQATEKSA